MPVRQAIHFLGQAATHFRQTGAIAPSSRRLARELALAVGDVPSGGIVIELGPGSGSVTEALRDVHPAAAVIAVENNPAFARRLSLSAFALALARRNRHPSRAMRRDASDGDEDCPAK